MSGRKPSDVSVSAGQIALVILLTLRLTVGSEQTALAQQGVGAAAKSGSVGIGAERKIKRLEAGILHSHQALAGLEGRMTKLGDEIDRLTRQLEQMPPPKRPREESDPPDAKRIYYRLPLRQRTEKTLIGFACQDGRISFIDYVAIQRARGRVREKVEWSKSGEQRIPMPVSDSDFSFELVGRVEGRGTFRYKIDATRRPDCPGETWEQAVQQGSKFQTALSEHDPAKHSIQFVVWHDCFDLFRTARSFVLKRKNARGQAFGVDWGPKESGADLTLGLGIGIEQ